MSFVEIQRRISRLALAISARWLVLGLVKRTRNTLLDVGTSSSFDFFL